ncbi:MAG: hypothetical protein OXI92_09905 [Acidobacteriota bacterium]|nr:hypothetical protein [Acidobacteriota bacterium]
MTTITFDTRKAVRNLQAAGFPEPLADGIVDTVAEAFTDTVATKTDIAGVKIDIADLKAELAGVKADLKIIKYFFGPAIILLLLKIAFF